MTNKDSHSKKPFKLDSIEKKAVFEVSETYFDDLPTRIQNKVVRTERNSQPSYILAKSLKFALPVIALIIMSIYFGSRFNNADLNIQALIDDVSTEELVAYLNDSELSTDEIIALIDIDELDIDGMLYEDIEFIDDSDFEELLDEYPEYVPEF